MILIRALRAVAGVEQSEQAIREGKIQSSQCQSDSGGGTPIVPICFPERMSGTQYGTAENLSPSLTALNPTAVAIQAGALRTNPNSGPGGAGYNVDLAYTLEARAEVQAVAFDLRGREGGAQFEGPHDTANLRAASGGSSRSYVAEQWAVRRLTVRECERLQGFPDGWTLIETDKRRTVEEGEAAYLAAQGAHVVRSNDGKLRTNAAADGPRYKALGNAWAVACVRPIIQRIADKQMEIF